MDSKDLLAGDAGKVLEALLLADYTESGCVRIGDLSGPIVASGNPQGIGDVASQARGSGARYNTGKADWSLMPTHLLEEVVRVWEYGAKKYAAWNWAKGMAWSVPYACMIRHLYAWWWEGERNDQESGYSHLAHVVCNVMMLMHFETKYQEGDDRPKEFRN